MRATASLRIKGSLDQNAISKALDLQPDYCHSKGESGSIETVFDSDMWIVRSPLDKDRPLEDHLEWLVELMEPRYESLIAIKKNARVDIFCAVTAGEQDGFSLRPKALSIFSILQIDLEVSLILGS
jgi:hypothetical protein